MSKRHQSSRRRSYGRRQHEMHEREGNRRNLQAQDEMDLDAYGSAAQADPFAFLDPRMPRVHFSIGE